MARPKVARISKSNVASTALAIIDADGLERLTLTKLAENLAINHASLYHHYRSKDDILDDVVRLALREIVVPDDDPDIVEWLVGNALAYRQMLIRHPSLAPLMGRWRHRHRVRAYKYAQAGLVRLGITESDAEMILEATEAMSLGFSAFSDDPARGELDRFEFCFRSMLDSLIRELAGPRGSGSVSGNLDPEVPGRVQPDDLGALPVVEPRERPLDRFA